MVKCLQILPNNIKSNSASEKYTVICKNELSDPQKAIIEVRGQGDILVVCMC